MELESAVLSEAEQQQQAAALKQELSKITDKLEKDRATFLEQEEELARLKTEVPVACLASACVCQSSPVRIWKQIFPIEASTKTAVLQSTEANTCGLLSRLCALENVPEVGNAISEESVALMSG